MAGNQMNWNVGPGSAWAAVLVVLAASWLIAPASVTASASDPNQCGAQSLRTADGCQSAGQVKKRLDAIIRSVRKEKRLNAVIARVDIGGRTLLRRGFGESQTGVPATAAQHFRLGSMSVPAVTSVLFQLRDEGRLKLGDPVARWLPGLPRAGQVSVRMLMNNSSGYRDWIQGNPEFVNQLNANPFRTWRERELLGIALRRGFACKPAACFNYAHTNYLILGRVIRKITGNTVREELRQRIFNPSGMSGIEISNLAPMPSPTLNAYTTQRGFFENSTGWSPSWGLSAGELVSGTVDDVAKGARSILSGRLLKPVSRRQLARQMAPTPAGVPPGTWFGQGLIVSSGWRLQNPYFNGYMGHMAWLPKRRIAIGLVTTSGLRTDPDDPTNFSGTVLSEIARYLTPAHVPGI